MTNFLIGCSMIAGVFIGLFILMVRNGGWKAALGTYGLTILLLVWVALAAHLISK